MKIVQVPGRIYDYLDGHYGWWGLFFAGLVLVFLVVAVCIIWDRRR